MTPGESLFSVFEQPVTVWGAAAARPPVAEDNEMVTDNGNRSLAAAVILLQLRNVRRMQGLEYT